MWDLGRDDAHLAWVDEPQPPHFATLYFSDTDHAGHVYGPVSPEVDAAIVEVDALLGRLIEGLEARDKLDAVDLMVVSDHGMTELSRERAIFIDDFVDPDDFWIAAWGAYTTLDPRTATSPGFSMPWRACHTPAAATTPPAQPSCTTPAGPAFLPSCAPPSWAGESPATPGSTPTPPT